MTSACSEALDLLLRKEGVGHAFGVLLGTEEIVREKPVANKSLTHWNSENEYTAFLSEAGSPFGHNQSIIAERHSCSLPSDPVRAAWIENALKSLGFTTLFDERRAA